MSLVYLLAVVLRVIVWALVDRADVYTLRVGMASEDEDLDYVTDIIEGRQADKWCALWTCLRFLGSFHAFVLPALCIGVDLLIGWLLHRKDAPHIAALWLLNPITVLSNALSLVNVHVLLATASVVLFSHGGKGRRLAGITMALATYLNPTGPMVMAVVMMYVHPATLLTYCPAYAMVLLLGISLGDDFASLSPFQCVSGRLNWGLHWYVHLEVFPSFSELFCYLLVLLTPGAVLPFAYKLLSEKNNELMALSMAYTLCVITSLRPTFVEYVGCAMLAYWASPTAVQALRKSMLLYMWALGLCFSLGNFFINAWLRYQSANANFFYFVLLAWAITLAAMAFEHCTAHVHQSRVDAK